MKNHLTSAKERSKINHARRALMDDDLRYGYHWVKSRRLQCDKGDDRAVNYDDIAQRLLDNGVLDLCSSCDRKCKIPKPNLPVKFTCYDYMRGGEPIQNPSEKKSPASPPLPQSRKGKYSSMGCGPIKDKETLDNLNWLEGLVQVKKEKR